MGNISEAIVQEGEARTIKVAQFAATQVRKLIEAISKWLEFNAKNEQQRQLAKYLKGGGSLYVCTDKVDAGKLYYELEKAGIIKMKTNNGKILVRQKDIEKVAQIERRLIIEQGRYYQMVSVKELSDAVARSENKDKDLFKISGLNEYEVESLKNKCNNIKKGFTVGVEEKADNEYDFAIKKAELYRDPRTLSSGKVVQDKDFSKAYLESVISLYGPNSENKHKQIEADKKFDAQVLDLLKTDGTKYIVSVDDPTKYIEVTKSGFTPISIQVDADGKFTVIEDSKKHISREDPNFLFELQRETDGYLNKAIIEDFGELQKHLSTKERNIPTERPGLSGKMYAYAKANDVLTETIDRMAREQVNAMHLSDPEEKFKAYTQEAKKILDALVLDDGTLDKYKEEDVKTLMSVFDSKEVDRDAYQTSTFLYGNVNYSIVKAEKSLEAEKNTKSKEDERGE